MNSKFLILYNFYIVQVYLYLYVRYFKTLSS